MNIPECYTSGTLVPVYVEYCDYLVERFAGIDPAALDLLAQVEHFWSSGALEPIVSSGLGPRYREMSVRVSDWLYAGLQIEHDNALELGAKIAGGWYDECDLYRALRYLTLGKPGKFYRSLIDQFVNIGSLSKRQIQSVLYPPKFNR